jgi:Fe-S-cluster containining protein
LDKSTPLRFNCGKLCNAACCEAGNGNTGMFLFPHEEERYKNQEGMMVTNSNWVLANGFQVKLLTCEGVCDRTTRPLACRIFPLATMLTDNEILRLKIDSRGRMVCPLCQEGIMSVQPVFRQTVRRALTPLMQFDEVIVYLKELTQIIEEMERFFE